MPAEPTNDHETLLIVSKIVEGIERDIRVALDQLARGNERFQAIALSDQKRDTAIADLRVDVGRAQHTAEISAESAKQAQVLADTTLRSANRLELALNGEKGLVNSVSMLATAVAKLQTDVATLPDLTNTVSSLVAAVAKLQTEVSPIPNLAETVAKLDKKSQEQETRNQLLKAILSPGGAIIMALIIAVLGGFVSHWLFP